MRMERVVEHLRRGAGAGDGRLMLYHLLYPLASRRARLFNVFRYITFRTGAATLTALFISFWSARRSSARSRALHIGQTIREDGPAHQARPARRRWAAS